MNTPEELKSQTKAKSEPEEYGPDDFSGSVQRTQLKAEGPADMKNKSKDKNTITNEKRGLFQPKVDHTARRQRSTETRTRRNKAKIEAMNGLENHHYTMQNTLTERQLKDKFEHGKFKDEGYWTVRAKMTRKGHIRFLFSCFVLDAKGNIIVAL